MKTDTNTSKQPAFIRLPSGEALRPRLIHRIISCGPDGQDEGFTNKPALKILLQGGWRTTIRFDSNEKRDKALDTLLDTLNA